LSVSATIGTKLVLRFRADGRKLRKAAMRVLSINCGSSSLKYALFDAREAGENEVVRGSIDRIGEQVPDHAAAVGSVLDDLERRGEPLPEAIGHRVVHGGTEHSTPARVDAALLESLRALVPFAPLHLPAEIRAIEAVQKRWSTRLQVACFDTSFHRTLSPVAQRYALPDDVERLGLHRYGFHGLSYEYVVASVGAELLGRAVIAHLGNGASMAAVCDGISVDTTMGFSPAGGLVMGTRLGDVDPGLLVHWLGLGKGHDAKALDDLVNRRSGLLGISGTTADVRDLLARRSSDPRAALALDVFTWSARKWVGAMAAAAGGLDTLVFTGGIGEHAAPVRAAIATGLEHLGVRIDDARNERDAAIVSPDGAKCTVRVVKTDEERMVARHARRVASLGEA
jgi:acetate kinase